MRRLVKVTLGGRPATLWVDGDTDTVLAVQYFDGRRRRWVLRLPFELPPRLQRELADTAHCLGLRLHQ